MKMSKCCTCGYSWITGQSGDHHCADTLKKELDLANKLLDLANKMLAERERVLRAIPACQGHGHSCVPHAIEWINRAKSFIEGIENNIAVMDMKTAPMDGTPILALRYDHYRFQPYKPEARKNLGKKGRWQKLGEHGGWENCEAPDGWIEISK